MDGDGNFLALVLEDDDDQRDGLIDWLQGILGVRSVGAATLVEAFRAWDAHEFDFACIDRSLPDGDGAIFACGIRALAPIPVAIISGSRPVTFGEATAFFAKPIDLEAFEQWILGNRPDGRHPPRRRR